MRLSNLSRPFVCAVIAEPDINACIKQIDYLENSGDVDAFEIDTPQLPAESLKDVFSSTNRPCIANCRRAEFMKLYGYESLPLLTSEQRAMKLTKALSAGASTIDFELDLFDEQPITSYTEIDDQRKSKRARGLEISMKPNTVRRQMEFATQVKEMGGEVIISCHSQNRIRRKIILQIADSIESRCPDFAKIVTVTTNSQDLITFTNAVLKLKARTQIPFSLLNMGYQSILGRLLSVTFGSSWIYCRPNSVYSYMGQPSIRQARIFLKEYFNQTTTSITTA